MEVLLELSKSWIIDRNSGNKLSADRSKVFDNYGGDIQSANGRSKGCNYK